MFDDDLPEDGAPLDDLERCGKCGKRLDVCVCDRVVPLSTQHRILILQHPREQDVDVGSVPLVLTSLPSATKRVGLSWPSLSKALGEETDPAAWAVVYPTPPKGAPAPKAPGAFYTRKGEVRGPDGIEGIVLLDGTWSHTKTLWWRNAWLLKLNRLVLVPSQPSIYGRLRKEPKKTNLSTLESVAEALVALGEPEEHKKQLFSLFRSMVQRARDAKLR